GLDQRGDPLLGLGAGADSGTHAQLAVFVLARQRVGLGLLDVVDGHHALETEGIIDHQHPLDTVLVQQFAHFAGGGTFLDRHQAFRGGHDVAYAGVQSGFDSDGPRGDYANQFAVVEHRYTGDVVRVGQLEQLRDGGVGVNGDRVLDHTGLELL